MRLFIFLIGIFIFDNAFAKVVKYELVATNEKINLSGKKTVDFALMINKSIPAPVLEFTEGDEAEITLKNGLLDDEVSIHWHGVLLDPYMDGVPYVNTPPIKPGESFTFKFKLRQHGTYWYHSHTNVQEQKGIYGAIVIHPKVKTEHFDKEIVAVVSDWSDENPSKIIKNLRKDGEYYAFKKKTIRSWLGAIKANSLKTYLGNEFTRMGGMDLSDVGYDAFLINGKISSQNESIKAGDKVRIRIINAAASTYFYVSMGKEPIEVIAADGQNIKSVRTNEIFIGPAETYDIKFTQPKNKSLEFRATANDGSGKTSLWLGSGEKVTAVDRKSPDLYMDMNMDHGSMSGEMDHSKMQPSEAKEGEMDHSKMQPSEAKEGEMDHSKMQPSGTKEVEMDHSKMQHSGANEVKMDHSKMQPSGTKEGEMDHSKMKPSGAKEDEMDHSKMQPLKAKKREMDHSKMKSSSAKKDEMDHSKMQSSGAKEGGMDHSNMKPLRDKKSNKQDPERYSHQEHSTQNSNSTFKATLTSQDYGSSDNTAFNENISRKDIALTLDGDMERYVWFINGKAIHEDRTITIEQNEVVRFTFVNNTMMNHPMHLHGHFFRVLNKFGDKSPLKHTIDVPPSSVRTIEFLANEPGDWMLHCHNLYHLKTGMARVVKYSSFVPRKDIVEYQKQDPHMHDHIYYKGTLEAATSHGELELSLMKTRDDIVLRGELSEEDKNKWEVEGDIFYKRWLSLYSGLMVGAEYFEKETNAIGGFSYLLPFLVETNVLFNSKKKLRLDVGKKFQWTQYVFTDVDFTFRQDQKSEYEITLMYQRNYAWAAGGMLSGEKVGIGFQYNF